LRSHDTVNDQTGALLKLFDGSLGRWTEDAVDNQPKVRSSTQRPLEPANGFAGRPRRYRWLSRIWHCAPFDHIKSERARQVARFGFPNTSKQRFLSVVHTNGAHVKNTLRNSK
jgi:hypothetical protein